MDALPLASKVIFQDALSLMVSCVFNWLLLLLAAYRYPFPTLNAKVLLTEPGSKVMI